MDRSALRRADAELSDHCHDRYTIAPDVSDRSSRTESLLRTPTDPCSLTAAELLALYRAKKLSPVEATRAVLERIERLNPVLNAFCFVAGEAAVASAMESETRWMKGAPTGLLDGVPASIKDLILTRGWPTLRGWQTIDPT